MVGMCLIAVVLEAMLQLQELISFLLPRTQAAKWLQLPLSLLEENILNLACRENAVATPASLLAVLKTEGIIFLKGQKLDTAVLCGRTARSGGGDLESEKI